MDSVYAAWTTKYNSYQANRRLSKKDSDPDFLQKAYTNTAPQTQELWTVFVKCCQVFIVDSPHKPVNACKHYERKQFGADIPNFWHPDCSDNTDKPLHCAAVWWA
jgi:hypothetical protein